VIDDIEKAGFVAHPSNTLTQLEAQLRVSGKPWLQIDYRQRPIALLLTPLAGLRVAFPLLVLLS
jgi:hypothetical protein